MDYDCKIDKQTTVNSFIWKITERIFSQGISLVVQIILARILVPDDFGKLAIIVAIINYAAIFVQSGIATAIIQKKDLKTIDISTISLFSFAVAALMYIVLFSYAPFIADVYNEPELKAALRVLAIILFFYAINAVQTAILSRKMKFKKLCIRSMLSVPISGFVGIIMAKSGFGIWALIAHHLVSMLVIVIFMSFDKDTHIKLGFSKDSLKQIYSFSWKLLLTGVITGFHDMLRTMIIGKRYSAKELAYYDKAYTYSSYVTLIVNTSISSVLLPVFSREQDDMDKLKDMARRASRLSAFIMVPVLFGVAAVSEALVSVLLTDKWLPSAPFLMIFCILRIPGCIMTADKQVYLAVGKSQINLLYEIGLFILNVTALIISIPHGPMAIALGATLTEIVGGFCIWKVSSKVYGYRIKDRIKDIIKPFSNSMIMAGGVYAIGICLNLTPMLELVIQIFCGIAIYIILELVSKDESIVYCLTMIKNYLKFKE